ncbi:MAG: tol-pal system protein YbgF [Betaproteobacteria bacterium]|nr:tol-pal system protein YbgF [Betaproteobacteria bacterium]
MKHRFSLRLCSAVMLAAWIAAVALPARAGLFDDDEARGRIEKLRNEVADQSKRLESAVATTSRSQIELANQIEQIKGDIAKLRGQFEVLGYELEAAQKRQNDFYVDLDNRLRKIETQSAANDAKAAAPQGAPPADPAAEMRDYETALTLFKSAKYKEALTAFLDFIKTYGSSGLLANAHYWAASAHFQLKEYAKAAELFAKVPATWPNDARAPDALLGQANSQQEAGDAKGARKTLEQLLEKYPASSAAQSAKQRIKKK